MGFVKISDDLAVPSLVPWLQKLVVPLLDVKYNDTKVKIVDLDSSAPLYLLLTEGYNKCDSFILCIPYALDTLRWPISFVWSHPELFPVIGFDDTDFKPNFTEVQALKEWNSTNGNALIHLVDEVLLMYKQNQILFCRRYERLAMELDNLPSTFDHKKYDVLITDNDAVFVFFLTVEGISELPKVYLNEVVENRCTLKVTYRNFGADSATYENLMRRLLGGKNCPKLPPFECFLFEYVERIQDILNEAVRDIKETYEFRRNFLARCRQIFRQELDGDYVYWTKGSFLINYNDFLYTLNLKLPANWPPGPVDVQAMSVYHEKRDETPYSEKFPWRPKFEDKSEDQLADEFRQFVDEISAKFHKSSRASGF